MTYSLLFARDEMRNVILLTKLTKKKNVKNMKIANCDINVGAKGKMTNSFHVGYVTST